MTNNREGPYVAKKQSGIDWAAIDAKYVANGGVRRPEVWRGASDPARPRRVSDVDRTGIGGRPRREVSPEDHSIRREYETGKSIKEIGDALGMGKTSVRSAIIRAGGAMRPKEEAVRKARRVEFTDEQTEQIIQRYTGGESSPSISKDFGVTWKTILRVLREQQIPIRDASAAQALNQQRGKLTHARGND